MYTALGLLGTVALGVLTNWIYDLLKPAPPDPPAPQEARRNEPPPDPPKAAEAPKAADPAKAGGAPAGVPKAPEEFVPVGEIRRFEGHAGEVRWLDFSPDGQSLVTACWDKTVRMFEVNSGRKLWEVRVPFNPHGVAFYPDGRRVAVGGGDRENTEPVLVLDAGTGAEVARLTGHEGGVLQVAVSPDGRWVAAGTVKTPAVWDAKAGTLARKLTGHPMTAAVAFHPDGRRALLGKEARRITVWDLGAGREEAGFAAPGHVMGLAVAADPKYVASCGFFPEPDVRLVNTETGGEVRRYKGPTSSVYSVAFTPDHRRLLAAGNDRAVRVWDAATGAELQAFTGHTSHVWRVAASPKGPFAASCGGDKTVRLWGLPK